MARVGGGAEKEGERAEVAEEEEEEEEAAKAEKEELAAVWRRFLRTRGSEGTDNP